MLDGLPRIAYVRHTAAGKWLVLALLIRHVTSRPQKAEGL